VAASIASVQFGAGIAVGLFSRAGAVGVVNLRLIGSAVVLLLIARPRWGGPGGLRSAGRRALGLAAVFGLVLALMNLSFYQALARLPQGAAVTIEFIGPLTLSLCLSRRRRDLAWLALAAAGVGLLGRGGLHGLNPVGVLFGLGAAACWACYILLSSRVGRYFPGIDGLALASVVAAVLVLPLGISVAGSRQLALPVLGAGLLVGVLSSALPYGLELRALRTLDPRTFGVLMSAEPAAGALVGLVVLHQHLAPLQVAGIVAVALASAGTTLGLHGAAQHPPVQP
jgi:inner membrane transporter RhtA